ncbi:MAG: YheT family hydrolase [Acidobacteriaceae bacterium]
MKPLLEDMPWTGPDPGEWMWAFEPRRFLSNGHLQTIAGNYLRRRNALPAAEAVLVEVAAATPERPAASRVLCHCHWQPEEVRRERLTVVLVHGLEGSSNSQYIVGNSNKLWSAGCNIVRMNMRNCGRWTGGTLPGELSAMGGVEGAGAGVLQGAVGEMAAYTPTLYHSGLSGDVLAVVQYFAAARGLESVALVGYSMGGNLVLKLAGESTPESFPQLRAVVGVSPALDLGPSADALHLPWNRVYEQHFLRGMYRRFRRKAELFPDIYSTERLRGIRTLREFDERITAFYEGFEGAADYYYRVAAARVLDRISVPTLVLHANDDPFVRLTQESREQLKANPNVAFVEMEHGGHCAFLATPDAAQEDDGYWAEKTLRAFLMALPAAAAVATTEEGTTYV